MSGCGKAIKRMRSAWSCVRFSFCRQEQLSSVRAGLRGKVLSFSEMM